MVDEFRFPADASSLVQTVVDYLDAQPTGSVDPKLRSLINVLGIALGDRDRDLEDWALSIDIAAGTVDSVVQGAGIVVDNTDPANPVVSLDSFFDLPEIAAPAAPAANHARIWAQDDGAGKTQLMVQFSTGAAVALATQP